MARILDYSFARPSPAQIKAKGYVGVMRYLAPELKPGEPNPKVIQAPEFAALLAAGLAVGLNWESYANRAREGEIAGHSDAYEALKQSDALGYHGPIYFSVDYDAPPGDQPALNAYFQGAALVLSKARLGAYGGYWPLSRLFNAGLITYGWQTVAWSGTNRESRAHLLQNGAQDFGGQADVNDVLKADWNREAPAPVPPPPPAPDIAKAKALMQQALEALG